MSLSINDFKVYMPAKNFDALITLLAPLQQQLPGFELVIVGEGSERPRLEAAIAQHDAGAFVHLPGRLSDDDLDALVTYLMAAKSR